MNIWAVIPTKPFHEGKTRLAAILKVEERRTLNRTFLERTLRVALQIFPSNRVIVVSRSAEARAMAERCGVQVMTEEQPGDLNTALGRASRFAQDSGAEGILSLSADLPLLESADLSAMLDLAPPRGIVIAGDRNHVGTNALLIQPANLIRYEYGHNSFAAHIDAARQATVHPIIIDRLGLGFDIDTPEDWKAWHSITIMAEES